MALELVCGLRMISTSDGLPMSVIYLLVLAAVQQTGGLVMQPGVAPAAVAQSAMFVEEHSSNVTARVNGSAILNCRVRRLLDTRQVSWGRGFEVLTGGLMLFSSDRRFQPLHRVDSQDWGLRILSVRHADQGWYFCQVSTSPPTSHYIFLSVVEPEVTIVGGPELFVHEGSTANLTCVVRGAHQTPRHVRWTHDDKLLQFDRSRAGVRVHTWHEPRRTVSSVLIGPVQPSDTGQYFCDPDGLAHSIVTLHVIRDRYPAAMQSDGGRPVPTHAPLLLLLCTATVAVTAVATAWSIRRV